MKYGPKKNNKGFSLVELIVVVLILVVVSVSLAPQIIKWANNSRVATDRQTVDDVISIARIALTEQNAYSAVVGAGGSEYTITISNSGCNIKKDAAIPEAGDAFVKAFCDGAGVPVVDSIDSILLKTTGVAVVVTVSTTGMITSNAASVLTSPDFE